MKTPHRALSYARAMIELAQVASTSRPGIISRSAIQAGLAIQKPRLVETDPR